MVMPTRLTQSKHQLLPSILTEKPLNFQLLEGWQTDLQVGLWPWGKPVGIESGQVVRHASLVHCDLLGG